jgi:hypothetical protein
VKYRHSDSGIGGSDRSDLVGDSTPSTLRLQRPRQSDLPAVDWPNLIPVQGWLCKFAHNRITHVVFYVENEL